MSLIELIVLVVVAGVILYLVNAFLPMEARVKQILNILVIVVVAVVVLVWLLGFLGVGLSGGPVVDMGG